MNVNKGKKLYHLSFDRYGQELYKSLYVGSSDTSAAGTTEQAVVKQATFTFQTPSFHSKSTQTLGDPFLTPVAEVTQSAISSVSHCMSLSSEFPHDDRLPSPDSTPGDPFLAPNSTTDPEFNILGSNDKDALVDSPCFLLTSKLSQSPHNRNGSVHKSSSTSSDGGSDDVVSSIGSKSPEYTVTEPLLDQSVLRRTMILINSSWVSAEEIIPTSDSSGIDLLLNAADVISHRHTDSPTTNENQATAEVPMDIDNNDAHWHTNSAITNKKRGRAEVSLEINDDNARDIQFKRSNRFATRKIIANSVKHPTKSDEAPPYKRRKACVSVFTGSITGDSPTRISGPDGIYGVIHDLPKLVHNLLRLEHDSDQPKAGLLFTQLSGLLVKRLWKLGHNGTIATISGEWEFSRCIAYSPETVSVLIANNKRRTKRRTTKSEGVRSSKRIKVRTTNDKKRNADNAFEVDAIEAIQTYLKRGKLNHNNKEDSLAKEGKSVEKAPQAGYRLVFRKDYRGDLTPTTPLCGCKEKAIRIIMWLGVGELNVLPDAPWGNGWKYEEALYIWKKTFHAVNRVLDDEGHILEGCSGPLNS
ncbi:uncharacterized protein MELLADRAFT_106385 [Melampsora larici-populina 98AG31]|uniref:Uncharacterized protein n=1 Tax=Melampsora larici-populina (strain 98AG31 / pathotype 3-4-7) TaxID=747676 RepID=F4RL76_MELLP|nr:uncharacterized protein MELLADRAFT_106385 [Melampsora larici-populina 98AG31]EGG06917.1 hypothetical protein MELLADRAFT_106385 [Melampsora larici-populina 98AG31]